MTKSGWYLPTFTIAFIVIGGIFLITDECSATCYFSPELQGSFITQGTITENKIQYSQINITEDSIPIWGICHKRIKNNVILMISSEETTCFRCFNLRLVSKNILRACTTDPDYISKCYTNEGKALASCPSDYTLQNNLMYTEIILYKQMDINGEEIRNEYCPINGRYKLNYNNDDGEEDFIECSTLDSELDNCPSSSAMNLRFKKCSFENHDITFECLGHWEGLNMQNYLALKNAVSGEDQLGPQYRCAIYEENPHNEITTIWFSKDSTCSEINTSVLTNKTDRRHYLEKLTLYPSDLNAWPHNNFCMYPDWLQGQWQHIIVKNNTLILRDLTSSKSYTMKCIDYTNEGNIMVFSRTQCDEEAYQCLKIKSRNLNIIEFQISSESSHNYTPSICNEKYFNNDRWLTQGRLDHNYVYSPCPVSGEFVGMIPDATNLCAKLSSQCSSEDEMHYEVSACDFDEVYEERKYRCLGQWKENDLVYTFTKRIDVGTYECFVGKITPEKQIFIKEAGGNCQRNMDPLKYGMELRKVAYCKKIIKGGHPTRHPKLETTTATEATKSTQFASIPRPINRSLTVNTRRLFDKNNSEVSPVKTKSAIYIFCFGLLLIFLSNTRF